MQLAPGSLQRDSRSDAPVEVGSRHQFGRVQICVGSIERFLESVYADALAFELEHRQIRFEREVEVSVNYKGRKVGTGRMDLVIDDTIIIELKAVENLRPVHDAQVISYLKMTGYPLGLLINFNVPLLKEGIRRLILSQ